MILIDWNLGSQTSPNRNETPFMTKGKPFMKSWAMNHSTQGGSMDFHATSWRVHLFVFFIIVVWQWLYKVCYMLNRTILPAHRHCIFMPSCFMMASRKIMERHLEFSGITILDSLWNTRNFTRNGSLLAGIKKIHTFEMDLIVQCITFHSKLWLTQSLINPMYVKRHKRAIVKLHEKFREKRRW